MTLNNGQTVDQPEQLVGTMFHLNVERLQIWGSVGLDVDNGRWAILGTRVGTYYTNVLKSDIKVVNDYSEFTEYAEPWLKTTNGIYAATCARLADEIRDTTGIAFFDLDAKTSKFFKQLQSKNHHQVDSMVSEAHTLQNV